MGERTAGETWTPTMVERRRIGRNAGICMFICLSVGGLTIILNWNGMETRAAQNNAEFGERRWIEEREDQVKEGDFSNTVAISAFADPIPSHQFGYCCRHLCLDLSCTIQLSKYYQMSGPANPCTTVHPNRDGMDGP